MITCQTCYFECGHECAAFERVGDRYDIVGFNPGLGATVAECPKGCGYVSWHPKCFPEQPPVNKKSSLKIKLSMLAYETCEQCNMDMWHRMPVTNNGLSPPKIGCYLKKPDKDDGTRTCGCEYYKVLHVCSRLAVHTSVTSNYHNL